LNSLAKRLTRPSKGWDWLDKGTPVDPAILVEELPSLLHKVRITQGEGTIKVSEVHISQVFEEPDRIAHII
jgi:hypothetical protein